MGHTDDVAEEAYNLDLSQRRAQTVAQRLGSLIDLTAFDVAVEDAARASRRSTGRRTRLAR